MGRKTKDIGYHELKRLYEKQGYPITKIAKILRVSPTKIYSELERTGIKPGPRTVNTSKELCEKCIYRGYLGGQNARCCNYILATKQSRGCKARHCIRFKEGDQIILKED